MTGLSCSPQRDPKEQIETKEEEHGESDYEVHANTASDRARRSQIDVHRAVDDHFQQPAINIFFPQRSSIGALMTDLSGPS